MNDRTRITWHWGERGAMAHAKPVDGIESFCGSQTEPSALMRPPFMQVRCEACLFRIPVGATHVFPNHYLELYNKLHREGLL